MRISIITATYNSGATLATTLQSILAQTHKDYEVIVVDGQSKDNTLEVLQQFEPLFEGRMSYTSEPDKGLYDAMNKGIRRATGDVIGLLNSDDFYTASDILSTISTAFESEDALDAVYGDIHYVRPDNLQKCVRYYSSRSFTRQRMRMGFMPAHPSFYCRREIYQQYGLYDTTYHVAADFEQLLRLIYVHRISTRYIPRDFVTMRTGGVSTSGLCSHLRIIQDHWRAFRQHHIHTTLLHLGYRYISKLSEFGDVKPQP